MIVMRFSRSLQVEVWCEGFLLQAQGYNRAPLSTSLIFSWRAHLVRNDPPHRSELWSIGPLGPRAPRFSVEGSGFYGEYLSISADFVCWAASPTFG